MNCYGKSFNKLAECRPCRWKRLCMTAADPPLMAMNAPSEKATRYILAHARSDTGNRMLRAERDRRYTKADLLEVITFMAALDIRSLTLVAQKLECPELNFSELAEIRGVSRQAMHKMVEKRLQQIPELAAVLSFRKHKNKQIPCHQPTTFMEEVCRIRRQTQENRLKKPKLVSNCLRKLRSSKPSLLSSPMSILKGAVIWKNDSTPSNTP